MVVSRSLLSFLCSYEGMRTSVYADSGGVKTIGCGHTGSGVNKGTITQDEAYRLLESDTKRFAECVTKAISVPLTQSMFDALVSLAYNVGCTGLANTGIPKLINQGHYGDAARKWATTNLRDRKGNYLSGLAKRRAAEVAMFWQDGMPQSGEKKPALTTSQPEVKGRQLPLGWWLAVFAAGAAALYGVSRITK